MLSIAACAGVAGAQPFSQSFDTIAGLAAAGWFMVNHSTSPFDQTGWYQGDDTVFTSHSGLGTAYIESDYLTTTATAPAGVTINTWLGSPVTTLHNNDTFSFWARSFEAQFPDRLQLRLSTSGTSTNVGTGTSQGDVGDFTAVLLDVNPAYTQGGFPVAWQQYSVTVSGIVGVPTGRFALRYFVEDSGPNGPNGEYIGIDDVVFTLGGGGGGPPGGCYANCDSSTQCPRVNVGDFTCFLQQYSAGLLLTPALQLTHFSNCDASTTAPVINVGDFTCFLQKYAAGCSSC
jgi:hypothetical protein